MHAVGVEPSRQERRLVDKIGEVGAGKTRCQFGDLFGIDINRQDCLFQVHFQYSDAVLLVGAIDENLAVEAATGRSAVLLNLLRNAIEARQNSARRELMISIGPAMDNMTVVAVADTGSGIPSDVMSKLFQPFITKTKGMGVGLSISRTIIESHGGQIVAEPNQTAERVFRFALRGSLPKCQNPNTQQQACTDNVVLSQATDAYVPDRGGSSQRLEYLKGAENSDGRIMQPVRCSIALLARLSVVRRLRAGLPAHD